MSRTHHVFVFIVINEQKFLGASEETVDVIKSVIKVKDRLCSAITEPHYLYKEEEKKQCI